MNLTKDAPHSPEHGAPTKHMLAQVDAPRVPNDEPFAEPPATSKKKPFSLIRTFVLADVITIGNAVSGAGAILASMSYMATAERSAIWTALVLLPVALMCDALDGAVARWRRKSSPLGADLDSLADIVSFGVAPAALGFSLGLRGGWDAILLCYFVACGIARLARYNVTAASLSDNRGKVKYYEGTPIPSSLGLVLALGIAFATDRVHDAIWFGAVELGPLVLHPLSLMYAVSGSLMISTIRIPKP
ncbi:MAG TPA: CDP-alcohol phosphatidyltransferase family protein [Labilithrix sp.]|nr:CDP-alcohol phosphatidyltransferase family protein [Labilithrix sp.]